MGIKFGLSFRQLFIITTAMDIVVHIREKFPKLEVTALNKTDFQSNIEGLTGYFLMLIDLDDVFDTELIDRLSALPVTCLCICMASYTNEKKIACAIEAGISHYVIKDTENRFLIILDAIINRWLKTAEKKQALQGSPPSSASAQNTAASKEALAECDSNSLAPSTNHILILMAEDNILNQKVALSLLKMRGYNINIVDNGKQAVEAYQQDKYHLILMDIQMPEMDGLEATRRIRELESQTGGHIPIVAVTAFGMQSDRESCLNAGMDAYLLKPLIPAELFDTIDKLLNLSQPESIPKNNTEYNKKMFDMETVLQITGGKQEIVKELINMFFENVQPSLDEIHAGIREGDGKKVRFGAHSLKGMGLNLSAGRITQIAADLEHIGKHNQLDQAKAKLAELKSEIANFKTAIQPIINGS